jgi:hypothetical protein
MAPNSYVSFVIFQEKCARELEIAQEEGQIARQLEMKKVPFTHTQTMTLILTKNLTLTLNEVCTERG